MNQRYQQYHSSPNPPPPPCSALQPSTPKHIQIELQHHQLKQKSWYDRTAALLPVLRRGQRVYMRIKNTWKAAVVVSLRDEPRSYDVITSSGTIYRRNRRHLRPDRSVLHDTQPGSPMYSDDDLCDNAAPEPVQTELPQRIEGSTIPTHKSWMYNQTTCTFQSYVLT